MKIDPSQKVKSETLIVESIGQWSSMFSLQSGRMESRELFAFVKIFLHS